MWKTRGENRGRYQKRVLVRNVGIGPKAPTKLHTMKLFFFPELVINYKDIRHRVTSPSKAEDGGIMFKLYERH